MVSAILFSSEICLFAPVFGALTSASSLSMLPAACEERCCWRGVGVWADLAVPQLQNGKRQEASWLLIFLTCHVCHENSGRCKKPHVSCRENVKDMKICSKDLFPDLPLGSCPSPLLMAGLLFIILFIILSASFGGCHCSWHLTVHAKINNRKRAGTPGESSFLVELEVPLTLPACWACWLILV